MKTLLKLEELVMAVISLYGLYIINADWWWYLLFLLGPDISMLGYLLGNKIGAYCYNFFHHKALALLVLFVGYFLQTNFVLEIGLVLLGHSSMDRFFGFGLKTTEGFKFTHLGKLG